METCEICCKKVPKRSMRIHIRRHGSHNIFCTECNFSSQYDHVVRRHIKAFHKHTMLHGRELDNNDVKCQNDIQKEINFNQENEVKSEKIIPSPLEDDQEKALLEITSPQIFSVSSPSSKDKENGKNLMTSLPSNANYVTCAICEKSIKKRSMWLHIKCHKPRSLSCILCDFSSQHLHVIRRHIRTLHRNSVIESDIDSVVKRQSLNNTVSADAQPPERIQKEDSCEMTPASIECNSLDDSSASFLHNEKIWPSNISDCFNDDNDDIDNEICKFCSKKVAKNNRRNHIKSHQPRNLFCTICEFSSQYLHVIRRHIRALHRNSVIESEADSVIVKRIYVNSEDS